MNLKERVAFIIKENKFKQKDLAAIMGVTEGYISYIMAGRKTNLSNAVACLLEEKLGYSAKWLLTGEEPKYKLVSKPPFLSDIHKKLISQIESMPVEHVKAVLVFLDSLDKLENVFKNKED